jgi:hypothetical protein
LRHGDGIDQRRGAADLHIERLSQDGESNSLVGTLSIVRTEGNGQEKTVALKLTESMLNALD